MRISRRTALARVASAFGIVALAAAASARPDVAKAQDYPQRPVTIMVGFSAGGAADILARRLQGKLSEKLGQPVIVENRPGATGNIANELVANAEPDGYTLLLVATSLVYNVGLYPDFKFDPVNALQPVAKLATYPLYLVTGPRGPSSVADIIASAKGSPESINYATSGAGTSTHLAAEVFALESGIKIEHIPYKGGGDATTSVLSGETDIHFGGTAILPLVQDGRLKLVAVTSPERLAGFPDTPTVAESIPGYEFVSWNGLFAPKNTPSDIVAKLNAATNEVLKDPEIVAALQAQDLTPAGGPPEELGDLVKAEIPKWLKVIEEAGISAN